jgi:hypothetical protein
MISIPVAAEKKGSDLSDYNIYQHGNISGF